MCETFVLDGLQTIDQLSEVVACNWFWKSASFAKHYKEVSLICREDEICVVCSFKLYQTCVKALYHVRVIDHIENLFLVFRLINFCLLFFV